MAKKEILFNFLKDGNLPNSSFSLALWKSSKKKISSKSGWATYSAIQVSAYWSDGINILNIPKLAITTYTFSGEP